MEDIHSRDDIEKMLVDRVPDEVRRRFAHRERLLLWLIPRLSGDDSQKETAVAMLTASLDEAHCEGLQDAASIAGTIAIALEMQEGSRVGPVQQHSRVARLIETSIQKLEHKNRSTT